MLISLNTLLIIYSFKSGTHFFQPSSAFPSSMHLQARNKSRSAHEYYYSLYLIFIFYCFQGHFVWVHQKSFLYSLKKVTLVQFPQLNSLQIHLGPNVLSFHLYYYIPYLVWMKVQENHWLASQPFSKDLLGLFLYHQILLTALILDSQLRMQFIINLHQCFVYHYNKQETLSYNLNTVLIMQQQSEKCPELPQLINILNSKNIANTPEQAKMIDNFILKYRGHNLPLQQSKKLILIIQLLCTQSLPQVKYLQLLRMLTKTTQLRAVLKPQFLQRLNETIAQLSSQPSVIIEILAMHLRYIEISPKLVNDEMFSTILDLLVMNNSEINKIIIEITRELTSHGQHQVLQEVWYVGRLLFALERTQATTKPKLVNLIKDLLDVKHFNENFRRINGVPTLIAQLRRCQSTAGGNNQIPNIMLKIALLNCIYRLLLTTKTQAIYDFKLNNFTSLISLKIKEPMNYKEIILTIKILTHLMLDNDISSKFIEDGIQDVIALLVRSHPTNCHMIKFEDIEDNDQAEAFEQFKLLLLRLLRYVSSLQRNRKIFKQIFPNELLMPFIDIGHFVKPLKNYTKTLQVFNKMDNAKVLAIEDEYEKLAKLFSNKNYKLQVVGNYNLLEQLGQGAFGSVFLAKKGVNQYALKRIKVQFFAEKKQQMEELSREVKIYKELKHPNIVKFYESFVQEGYLYIVMEVIKGCNLSELIRNQNQKAQLFEQAIVWKILICILSVLRYLHIEKKIIHRDLNPSNIMIDNKFNIKVTDFGLAKSISSANNNKMGQSFVGTVAYSAPQIVQRQDYNQKADIWSLGCILHELMCLKAPFSGNNPLLLAKVIVNKQFTSELPTKYSEQLRQFVEKCLIADQSKRPDVKQLLTDVVERIVTYSDELKDKQSALSDEILQLSKKINAGGFNATHTRLFGNSLYNSHNIQPIKASNKQINPSPKLAPTQDLLRQTQLVKIDSQVLNKIGQDPMSKFIDVVKKLSLISSTQASLKKNFKKYIVDTFYNRVMISDQFSIPEVKNELNKLINLSKEQVSFLGVKFELKQNYIKSITYQMLYFYIEELYELIKK